MTPPERKYPVTPFSPPQVSGRLAVRAGAGEATPVVAGHPAGRYGSPMAATLGQAMRLGASGLGRERWLVAVGLLDDPAAPGAGRPGDRRGAPPRAARRLAGAARLAPFSGVAPLLGAAGVALQPRVRGAGRGLARPARRCSAGCCGWPSWPGRCRRWPAPWPPTPSREPRFADRRRLGAAAPAPHGGARAGAGVDRRSWSWPAWRWPRSRISEVAAGSGRVWPGGGGGGRAGAGPAGARCWPRPWPTPRWSGPRCAGDGPVEAVLQASQPGAGAAGRLPAGACWPSACSRWWPARRSRRWAAWPPASPPRPPALVTLGPAAHAVGAGDDGGGGAGAVVAGEPDGAGGSRGMNAPDRESCGAGTGRGGG